VMLDRPAVFDIIRRPSCGSLSCGKPTERAVRALMGIGEEVPHARHKTA
jgi:hypothetical protein